MNDNTCESEEEGDKRNGRDGGGRLHSQKSSCSGCCKVPVLPTNQTKPNPYITLLFCIRNKIERERERERERGMLLQPWMMDFEERTKDMD
jgi:hypothetical protein